MVENNQSLDNKFHFDHKNQDNYIHNSDIIYN